MKLLKITIKNFRCYKEEFEMKFDDLTTIIAKNDVGKSTVLDALNAFFNSDKLEAGDRSVGLSNSDDIVIKCFFNELPNEVVVDTDNLISPANEYMLNEDGYLVISKYYSGASPKCEKVIINSIHPKAEGYDDLFDLNISKLKRRASELKVNLESVNQTIKSSIRHAIWKNISSEELELNLCELDITKSIWKTLQKSLPLFQLFKSDRPSSDQDAEAQDPIKFAIKEALNAKSSELEMIEKYVKGQVEEVTNITIEKLREMDSNLASQLDPKFGSFNWSKVFSVSLTNDDQIPLNKRGSGVRRLFLLNFFRARAEQLSSIRDVQDVIYAIEEPETSQHPNNQLILLDAFEELSIEDNCQVIITTHNPVLAGRVNKESIRYICKNEHERRDIAVNSEETFKNIKRSLGMFANHNVRIFVGVEGPNDIEYLKRISKIFSNHYANIVDLGLAEHNGNLVFIPMGGSTLELWTNRLEGLEIPEIHIMDRDYEPPHEAKYKVAADEVIERGELAYITSKRELENYIHYSAINKVFGTSFEENFNDFADVPELVARKVNSLGNGTTPWEERSNDWKKKKMSKVKKRLNRETIDLMTFENVEEVDNTQEIKSWLEAICGHLIEI